MQDLSLLANRLLDANPNLPMPTVWAEAWFIDRGTFLAGTDELLAGDIDADDYLTVVAVAADVAEDAPATQG